MWWNQILGDVASLSLVGFHTGINFLRERDFGHGLEVVVAEPVEARRLQVAEVVVDTPRAGVEQLVRVDVHEPLEPVARLRPPEAVQRVEHLPHLDVALHIILQGRPAGQVRPRGDQRLVANDHFDVRVAARRLDVRGLRGVVEVEIDPREADPLVIPYKTVQALRGVFERADEADPWRARPLDDVRRPMHFLL